ncbi:MAG: hydrogenase nickel incorporation protein HypB [Kiritimatiellaeota bacterium]|nr:hydrogenase nickel incorporation protein HypB [Kiritimatiellota bacterium]
MPTEIIRVYRDVLSDDRRWAQAARALLQARGWILLNLIGSPGSGKTALLEKLAGALRDRAACAVIEADCATTRDAERIRGAGLPVSQILTGDGCHVTAAAVHQALSDLPLAGPALVFVENVGNLVCPASCDIGEAAKIAVLSVTEGEDKPLKYPILFRAARAVVLTKTDLLPHLRYRLEDVLAALRQVNGATPIFQISAKTGAGLPAFADWLLTVGPPE